MQSPLIHTQPMNHGVGVRSLPTVGVGIVLVGALLFAVFGSRGEVEPAVAPMEQVCTNAAVLELGGEPSGEYQSTWIADGDWTVRTTVKTDRWVSVTCVVRLQELRVVKLSTR